MCTLQVFQIRAKKLSLNSIVVCMLMISQKYSNQLPAVAIRAKDFLICIARTTAKPKDDCSQLSDVVFGFFSSSSFCSAFGVIHEFVF